MQESPASPRAAKLIVFLVVFVDLLGFGIVLPLLPRFAKEYLPVGTSENLAGLIIGVMYSSFSLMTFLTAPIWGRWSDRVGRRPALLFGLMGSVVFYALFGFACSLSKTDYSTLPLILIVISRLGAGIFGATLPVAAAVIADSTTPDKRAGGMALIGAAFGIGFTFGPLIAYAAMIWFPDLKGGVGYIAAGISAISLFLCWKLLPETRRAVDPSVHRKLLDVKGLWRTLKLPTIGLVVLTFFLATFAFANFEATLSLLTQEAFGYSNEDNFLVFAYVGFVLMFAAGYLYRKLTKKLPETTLMKIGVLLMFVGLANLALVANASNTINKSSNLTWFLVTLFICVTGFAFMTPSVQAIISKRSDPNRQGEVQGVNQSFSALARILGPITGLGLFPLTSTHLLPYAVAAGLLGFVLLLIPRIGGDT